MKNGQKEITLLVSPLELTNMVTSFCRKCQFAIQLILQVPCTLTMAIFPKTNSQDRRNKNPKKLLKKTELIILEKWINMWKELTKAHFMVIHI
jgi:hypothetical protein